MRHGQSFHSVSEQSVDAPAKVIGVLGGTGMGKTTFLLALYKLHQQSARLVSNQPAIPAGLTVKQYLSYAAAMAPRSNGFRRRIRKLRRRGVEDAQALRDTEDTVPLDAQITQRVDELIRLLQLRDCQDYLITSDKSQLTISHGQRARVTIGFVLATIASPIDYLILDEPLSSLDLRTAIELSRVFHDIVHHPESRVRTIVYSVHQPPATVWLLIDQLVILHNMKILYAGPRISAEYFLITSYPRSQGFAALKDPASRIYSIIEDMDGFGSDWEIPHQSELVSRFGDSEKSTEDSDSSTHRLSWWGARQRSLIRLITRSIWLANPMVSLLFAPLAFMCHGVLLGLLLRRNYESSVVYAGVQDAISYNRVDTIPNHVFASDILRAFNRMWPSDSQEYDELTKVRREDLAGFCEFRDSLSSAESEDNLDFQHWPFKCDSPNSTSTTAATLPDAQMNPIEYYMKYGPNSDGRVDLFDAIVFKKPTIQFAHRLIWCVRDNLDLFADKLEVPAYSPRLAEWLLPLRREREWRNNIYDAASIPEAVPYIGQTVTLSPPRQLKEESPPSVVAGDAENRTVQTDRDGIDWNANNFGFLTAELVTTEVSTLVQLFDAGLFQWRWDKIIACMEKKDISAVFYLCLLGAYPARYQSVVRCMGLPQLPFIDKLDLPEPEFKPSGVSDAKAPKRSLHARRSTDRAESFAPSFENETIGLPAPAPPPRKLLLEYDEHWSMFVGLRKLTHALQADFLFRLLMRLLDGVVLMLTAGVCLFFLIISSGFFSIQAMTQWIDLRKFGSDCRANHVVHHAYEILLAFSVSAWPQAIFTAMFLSAGFILACGVSWSLIPISIVILTLQIQALAGYVILVVECTTSLLYSGNEGAIRVVEYVLVVLVELSGFFIRPSNFPRGSLWLTYLSPYKWANEALSLTSLRVNQHSARTSIPQEINLAIVGTTVRSIWICLGAMLLQYLLSLGLATVLYTVRVTRLNRTVQSAPFLELRKQPART